MQAQAYWDHIFPFHTHYPARGRKRSARSWFARILSWFHTHYPARGRKLKQERKNGQKDQEDCVSHPLPRKGTETLTIMLHLSKKLDSCFTPITPQGDGNARRYIMPFRVDESFTPITPQGDGNSIGDAVDQRSARSRSFTPITPQGDGNCIQ